MSETKLLRCPFCNSEDLTEGSLLATFGEDIYIKCRTCGLKLQLCSEYGWEELERRWNTRIPMQNIMERLKKFITIDKDIFNTDFKYFASSAIREAIEIVKEEGGVNDKPL